MTLAEGSVDHFRVHGWMRVSAVFSAAEAAAMRDAVWRALEGAGIHRDRPSSWTIERPSHLQQLKTDPVFEAVRSTRVRAAIDAVLEGQRYDEPKNVGAFFLAFPSKGSWGVPTSGWHIDANYLSELAPPAGVRTHALFGDVGSRGGGTQLLSGSHRLVHKWFKDDGIPLRVVENTGAAGDVILLHPLVLHVAASNTGSEPRFLLSGGVDTRAIYADSKWGRRVDDTA